MNQNDLIPPPNQKKGNRPRWACPLCRGDSVRVLIPAWHYETRGCALTIVQTDEDSSVKAWYCEDCVESGDGSPIDLFEAGNV